MAGAITRTVAAGVDAVTVIKMVETPVATKEQADEILEAGQEAMEAGVEMARRKSIGVVLAEMISFGVIIGGGRGYGPAAQLLSVVSLPLLKICPMTFEAIICVVRSVDVTSRVEVVKIEDAAGVATEAVTVVMGWV